MHSSKLSSPLTSLSGSKALLHLIVCVWCGCTGVCIFGHFTQLGKEGRENFQDIQHCLETKRKLFLMKALISRCHGKKELSLNSFAEDVDVLAMLS